MRDDTQIAVSQRRGRHIVTAGSITWDYVGNQLGKPLSPLKLCVWGFHRITDTLHLVSVRDLGRGKAYCRLTREFPSNAIRHTLALVRITSNKLVTSRLTGETRTILRGSFAEDTTSADRRFPPITGGREFGVIFNAQVPWPESPQLLLETNPLDDTLQTLAAGGFGFGVLRLVD